MKHNIIVDSCCDMTPQMRETLGVTSVPLTMHLGSKEFLDDDTLNMGEFMSQMKSCTEKVGSSSPPPELYRRAIGDSETAYVVTLSSQLSGSHSSAMIGKSMAEETGEKDVHVLDSKSASAGETLIAVKLHRLLTEGGSKEKILSAIKQFIDNMKTYFVLENYDNLQKNGRLGKIKGKLIQILNIRLIMGADGNGNIALYGKARGLRQMIDQLLLLIERSGRAVAGEDLVISHCNNPEFAEQLSEKIKKRFAFRDVLVVPTGGISSLYADDRGLVMAF